MICNIETAKKVYGDYNNALAVKAKKLGDEYLENFK